MTTSPKPIAEVGAFWNQRYAEPGFAYGTCANDFLRAQVNSLPPRCRVVCLAEGEGRNAVFLAAQGHDVLALDVSEVGLAKARELASQRGVTIRTEVCDLSLWIPEADSIDAIVSIWAHLPSPARAALHARCVAALAPGGVLLLEAYTPSQLEKNTGGPRDASLMMTAELLRLECEGLDFEILREVERMIDEGPYHRGESSVVQVLAKKLVIA